jgi:predicted nucleic acid-binding Zn ribbon protein
MRRPLSRALQALAFCLAQSLLLSVSSNRPQRLGDVLRSVIDDLGLRENIDEARIIKAWEAVAGPQVNGVTENTWVEDGRFFVQVRSAAWRQELQMQRGRWRERLNDELGGRLVREIVFR